MRVRVCQKSRPWYDATETWFYNRQGEVFEVIAIHETVGRLYEVDVRQLAARGQIGSPQEFIPAEFAEEICEHV